ncbi:MAG: T9SS type A sorting domain-containing protein [Chitinophagaceae bacterium]|nr:T9SS type A sorting domain-containing protein [Chitinophagaceae bacterium]
MRIFLFLYLLVGVTSAQAQFAPQALQPGSTAIHKDSNIILGWAGQCSIQRGYQNIADTILGLTSQGDSLSATGYADGNIVSLGDGGIATYYFSNPLTNGPGADFALFENGFLDPLDSNMAYLEFAFVEVSNDGLNYYRFPATCDQDTNNQIAGTGQYVDTRKMNGLAGKYIGSYGTPFDLQDLSMILSLDVNQIRYVRIIDVIGSLNKLHGTFDQSGHIINDPYPTPYPTGGFDLDALGIIHAQYPLTDHSNITIMDVRVYPNPANRIIHIEGPTQEINYRILSSDGRMYLQGHCSMPSSIDLESLPAGFYVLQVKDQKGNLIQRKFLRS